MSSAHDAPCHRRTRRLAALATLVVLTTVAACGVEPDASPRDLPDDEQELEVSDLGGDATTGASRVYLIGPGEERRLLRSVQRDANSETELIQTLLRGPNDAEAQAEFDTAIPATTELLERPDIRGQIMTVNLTSDIDELDTQTLVQAIAQIVYTATELDDVESVRIEIDGQRLTTPTANGETTTLPVQIYDYPNAVASSQPAFPAAPLAGGN